jgi:hypothetical protein
MLAPSVKVTVPVGVPAPGDIALTVAVSVRGWPKTSVVGEDDRIVAEDAWLTLKVKKGEPLGKKFKSPR